MSEKRLTGWNKQTYCYTRSEDAKFKPGLRGAALYRDFGIAEATGGQLGAHHTILDKEKHTEKTSTGMHTHDCDFQFVYCLKGSITFVVEGVEGELRACEGSLDGKERSGDPIEPAESGPLLVLRQGTLLRCS